VGGSIQTPSFSEAIAALEVLDGKTMLAFVAYFPMAFDFDVQALSSFLYFCSCLFTV
jgi:hypothetical protein